MADDIGAGARLNELFKKYLKYVYAVVFLIGLYLIFIAKDYVAGVPIAIIAGILLTIPPDIIPNDDDDKVTWDEFAKLPIGQTLAMGKQFEEYMKIDEIYSEPNSGRYFLNIRIRHRGSLTAYEVPAKGMNPAVYILRHNIKPKKDGEKPLSRFAEYIPPMWGAITPYPDIAWEMQEIEKSENPNDPIELRKRFREVFGIKHKKRQRQTLDAQQESRLMGDVG